MSNLEKQHLIKIENLDPAYYFQSILEEAHRLKLLTDSELESIQLQSLQLLAKQTERYTRGESSSVRVETAQSIMQSIFYSIGIYLKSFPDPDLSIEVLKQSSLLELYQRGRKLIETQFDSAKQLLDTVHDNSLITDNLAYNDTMKGIPFFFSAYDLDFAAHDTPASIDYPLSNDKMELVGVEYIHNYLQMLFLENQFCKNFTEHDIHCLLSGYDDHYQDLLINIFGLVLTNAVASILANKKAAQLNIEPSDRQFLQYKLAQLSKDELDIILRDASTQLCEELNITNMFLQNHIAATALDLSARLKNALENDRLESVFISFKEKNTQPAFQFEDGEKMDDDLFRSIAAEIRDCRYVSDKIAIIRREIHSITDLVDILEGYCIFDAEFTGVFQSLGDMELALLLKKLPTHIIDPDLHFTENEKEWQNKLSCFFNEIDPARRENIRELADKIGLGHLNK
ncbi:MAG: hypothetical protein IBX47_11055 [Desulfuromonadales bacterium]|nr:hypothetical protein [Desulfuromonadales bacterium]